MAVDNLEVTCEKSLLRTLEAQDGYVNKLKKELQEMRKELSGLRSSTSNKIPPSSLSQADSSLATSKGAHARTTYLDSTATALS